MKFILLTIIVLAMALDHAPCGAMDRGIRIRLKVGDTVLTAPLIDSKTTRDFISLLLPTLTMNDLFHREKFAHMPKAISTEGERAHTYEVREIAYWSPGPDVAIYYRQDGDRAMDKLDCGAETFNVNGSVEVTIELVK